MQSQAIPPALDGRDVIATAQTGTGKTLAFVVPILEALGKDRLDAAIQASIRASVHSLILTPTRELAMQIHEVFCKLAGKNAQQQAVCVVGGMNESKQLRAIRGGASIIIATPGRLVDFLDRKLVRLGSVKMLVLDEADRMLDMGFLPSLKRILGELPEKRQTMFFSATIEQSVKPLIATYLKDPVRVALGSTTKVADNVDLHVYEVEQAQKLPLLQSMLEEHKGSFLVFVRTKHGTERLALNLARAGMKAARIHGDRTQNQRNEALRGFKDNYYRILVATDVAARGIDVQGISHVVNFDLPQVPEDFLHRVGRTARAGMRGTASTFCMRGERHQIRQIEKTLNVQLTRQQVPERAREISRMAPPPETAAKVVVMAPRGASQSQPRGAQFAPKKSGLAWRGSGGGNKRRAAR